MKEIVAHLMIIIIKCFGHLKRIDKPLINQNLKGKQSEEHNGRDG